MELVVEIKDQENRTPVIGGAMITPPIEPEYWKYRVKLGETQAIVAFPKFGTIGIGFAEEEDWNTNLPWSSPAQEIFDHIRHNKGDDSISDEDCVAAIKLIQAEILEGPDAAT